MIKDIMNHNADAAAGQKELEVLKKYFPQCFHADGYGLTEDAEEVMLGNYKAYWKDDHLYMINPDRDFNETSIAALMDKYNGEPFSPHNIVIFGYSFGFTHREELQKNLRTLKDGNKTLTVNIDVRY